jgi:hypothetical protein
VTRHDITSKEGEYEEAMKATVNSQTCSQLSQYINFSGDDIKQSSNEESRETEKSPRSGVWKTVNSWHDFSAVICISLFGLAVDSSF